MILAHTLTSEMTGKEFFTRTGTKQNNMESTSKVNPTIIVILGATGDLTWRKLIPAIYNLWLDQWIPGEFAVIGISRIKMTREQFEKHLHEGVDKFSRRGKSKKIEWDNFAKCLTYQIGEFDAATTYAALKKQIAAYEKKWKVAANRIFYLAVPPNAFKEISVELGTSGLAENKLLSRLVIEKPFGHDLESAKQLNSLLHTIFDESQI